MNTNKSIKQRCFEMLLFLSSSPLQQLVWSPALCRLYGQMEPVNDRQAGIETSSGSVRNPPPNDCSSRTTDCVLEMSTLDFLNTKILQYLAKPQFDSTLLCPYRTLTQLTAVAFLLLCAQKLLQSLQIIDAVLLASG